MNIHTITKKLFLFLILIVSVSSNDLVQAAQDHPLMAVLLMVKNEADNLEKTLEPFLKGGLQHFLMLDTGSTDGTIEIAQNLFDKYHVQHGYIIEQPFIDFATSRNYLIDEAERIFPSAHFFMMIDAEWYVQNLPGLLQFCQNHINDSVAMYGVTIHMVGTNSFFPITRLFKPNYGLRFEGVVHETLWGKAAENCLILPNNIYFRYEPNDLGQRKSAERWKRDLGLLLNEYEKNPENLRTIFFVAQTYQCLQDFTKACEWYEKRCALGDAHPESFTSLSGQQEYYISYYRCAQIYQYLGNTDKAINYYQKAFNFNKNRAEPLVRLAHHYLQEKNYEKCFSIALAATKVPYPDVTAFFIEPDCYSYHRYHLLAQSALHVKQYKIGKEATQKALQRVPNSTELQNLLKKYLEFEHKSTYRK